MRHRAFGPARISFMLNPPGRHSAHSEFVFSVVLVSTIMAVAFVLGLVHGYLTR